jgi:hypothetical protein
VSDPNCVVPPIRWVDDGVVAAGAGAGWVGCAVCEPCPDIVEIGLVIALVIALVLPWEDAGEDCPDELTDELVETGLFRRGRRGNGERRSQKEVVSDSRSSESEDSDSIQNTVE